MTLSQAKEKVAEHRPDLSKKEQMKIAQQIWLGWLLSMNIPGALLSAAAIIISLIALLK